jgi:butyrate kinase
MDCFRLRDNNMESPRSPIIRVSDLVTLAGHLGPRSVIIPGGEREDDLRLAESARDHGLVDRCILVGNEQTIREAAEKVGISVPKEDIIATKGDEEAAARTVEAVRAGGVDVILKGGISTPILNRAMMRIVIRDTISLVTMFDTAPVAGGRPMLLTDPGVTTMCNFGRLVGLTENAIEVARSVMGIAKPRVAILSANEKVIDSLPSTKLGKALTERHWENSFVYGPLSFDLAVNERSAGLKGFEAKCEAAKQVVGQADILVCPGIDSANILYKMIMETVEYGMGTFAGITVGVMVPYVILSRADNVETKLQSIALCSLAVERMAMYRPEQKSKRIVATEPKVHRVLVVNPGSTSTKVALFEGERRVTQDEVAHEPLAAGAKGGPLEEAARRAPVVNEFLKKNNIDRIDAIAARGGFLPRPGGHPLPGGTYVVTEVKDGKLVIDREILNAMVERPERPHASNVGIPLGVELARRFVVPTYIVDPVVADEFTPEARISGMKSIERRSAAHVLSIRASARRAAERSGTPVEQTAYVVAHMGGGITVAAVRGGRITDNTVALLGEGPFTPRRAGSLPLKEIIELCYSGKFTKEQLFEELTQRGGLQSYLGESRMEVIEKQIEAGDQNARLVVEAMVYQISKAIGAMWVAAGPDTEAIILTGGLSRSEFINRSLKRRLSPLCPVIVFKDTPEMEALAEGVIRVLDGVEQPLRYGAL